MVDVSHNPLINLVILQQRLVGQPRMILLDVQSIQLLMRVMVLDSQLLGVGSMFVNSPRMGLGFGSLPWVLFLPFDTCPQSSLKRIAC
jgi:hypothetical protein